MSKSTTKKPKPLSPTERSKLAYRRKKETHKFVRLMLLNETREKLTQLVEGKGMSQNDFFEYLINREFEIEKEKSGS
ncbi:TPA: RepB family protein [Escherichia coli]